MTNEPGSTSIKFPCEKSRLKSIMNLFSKKVLLRPFPDALFIYLLRAAFPNYKTVITVNLPLESIKDQMIRGFTKYLSLRRTLSETVDTKLDGQVFRFGFEGWDGFSMGNAYLKVEEGYLTLGEKFWSFEGMVRMLDELFDFNLGIDPKTGLKYRTRLKESMVKIGRLFPGRPFSVHYLDQNGEDKPLAVHLEGSLVEALAISNEALVA